MIGNGQLEGLAECEPFVDAGAGCRADNGDGERGTRQSDNPIVNCGMRLAACVSVHTWREMGATCRLSLAARANGTLFLAKVSAPGAGLSIRRGSEK